MTKILIVGDLHLRAKRLGDVAQAWKRVVDWAHDHEVSLVAQAGDVFDHYNVYGREASTGTVYEALLAPFGGREKPIRMFSVVGNHDMGGPSDVDAMAPVDKYPWITVARTPGVTMIEDGLSICAMPWLNKANLLSKLVQRGMDPKEAAGKVNDALSGLVAKLKTQVREHKKLKSFVLFVGHLEVTGAKLTGGMTQANGSFEFAPAALADIGCDAYALAHIHIRQHVTGLPNPNDGYLGTLCQLNFGEQGNKVGCRLLEIEGGEIKSDQWLENQSSPKYYTVDSLSGVKYKEGFDYVKLRGETKPEVVPDGVIFEKIPSAAATKRRTETQLDAEASLETLLENWAKLDGCEVPLPLLVSTAKELISTATLPSDAIGSLEKITRVTLKNITCHKDTTVDLSRVNGLCAIEGPTGSGKTTIIEAIMIGLYGSTPSRPSLNSWVSTGHKGDAMVEVEFVSSGKHYIVRRELRRTDKTFSHKAYLFEVGKSDAIAGPNVDNVLSKTCELVGDPSMVWAGAFSSQDEAGSLLDVEPADRKKLFAKLLGTEKFLFLSGLASKASQADIAVIDAGKNRVLRVRQETADEPEIKKAIQALKTKLAESGSSVAALEKDVDAAKEALSGADSVRADIVRARALLDGIQKKKDEVLTKGRAIKEKKNALEKIDAEAVKADLEAARAEKEAAEKAGAKAMDARVKAAEMEKKAGDLRAEASQMRITRLMEHTRRTMFQNNEYNALAAERAAGRKSIDDAARGLEVEQGQVAAKLADAERRQKLLEGFPDESVCRTCPLAKDGLEGRDTIPFLKTMAKELAESLEEKSKARQGHEEETVKLLAAKKAEIETIESWQLGVLDEASKKDSEAEVLEFKAAKMKLTGAPTQDDLEKLGAKVTALAKAFEEASGSKQQVAVMDAQLSSLRDAYRDLEEQSKAVVVPPEPDDAAPRAKAKELHDKLVAAREQSAADSRELGRSESRLESYAEKKVEAESLLKDVAAREKSVAVNTALARAFGRDGIPQLVVDGAIPRFEEIMSNLLREFDGRWSIQINSQSTTKKGSVKEVIEIVVDDGCGERELFTYSGGEKRVLKGVVRLAFSALQAERSGKGLRVLVLDEATDKMDADVAHTFIRMLSKASGSFKQVFIVSHSDHVLSTLPSRIVMSRAGSTTRVIST